MLKLLKAEGYISMNDKVLKEQLDRLQKELSLAGAETDKRLLELRVEMDRLKLETAALRSFLSAVYPSFAEQFPQILAETIQEVDPESD
jgi:hypothetical protein